MRRSHVGEGSKKTLEKDPVIVRRRFFYGLARGLEGGPI
jgi:hypothetical protein